MEATKRYREPAFVKRLPAYARAKREMYKAARLYAARFAEFSEGACDDLALAVAENELDKSIREMTLAAGWREPVDRSRPSATAPAGKGGAR